MHVCLHIAWWHLCAPERKRITFQTTSLHETCLIRKNAEQQQTGRKSVSLGYSALLGDATNFAKPNPTLTTSLCTDIIDISGCPPYRKEIMHLDISTHF